jgi:hypothetical protein
VARVAEPNHLTVVEEVVTITCRSEVTPPTDDALDVMGRLGMNHHVNGLHDASSLAVFRGVRLREWDWFW